MNIVRKTIVLLALLFCGLAHFSEVNAETVIKVVGDHAPPFRIFDKHGTSGIYFDVMKEIGKRMDAVIQIEQQPFKRALFSIESGSADVMCGPVWNANRQQYMVYTEAKLPSADKAFYVLPDSPLITRYEDLQHKKIATVGGSLYFDQFDKDPLLKKTPVSSYEQAMKKVLFHRDDVVIIPEQEGDYLLKQLGIKLKKCPFIVEGQTSYIAISKKSSVLMLQKRIVEIMTQMHKDGTMEKILGRYR